MNQTDVIIIAVQWLGSYSYDVERVDIFQSQTHQSKIPEKMADGGLGIRWIPLESNPDVCSHWRELACATSAYFDNDV